ncbi:hypothetical protein RJ639_003023 [Escallonia herrerae]|uniref:F-box domain-containing protein n=1 Tax=Escallonia herrerae TaxID=1293975 RepID=A0AA88W2K9_9ASTE|nr:hypothetical protein RJ639_003023 [Escallonia herrerae]
MASSSEPQNQLPDEDRLSNLPDSLIYHILSFLPTKCAVITSALSTKWRYQWTSIANLVFCDEYTVNDPPRFFENFADRTLVALTLGPGIALDVIPTSACLPSLKVLHSEVVEFRNVDSTRKLFNVCPVHENLVIHRETTDKAKFFNVCAPVPKRLTMKMFYENRPNEYWRTPVAAPDISDYTCVVDCPTLEHLDITDYTSNNGDLIDLPTFSNLTKLELRLLDDFSDWTWFLDMLLRTPLLQGLLIDNYHSPAIYGHLASSGSSEGQGVQENQMAIALVSRIKVLTRFDDTLLSNSQCTELPTFCDWKLILLNNLSDWK